MGSKDGALYFEAHTPLEDDTVLAEDRLQALLDAQLGADSQALNDHLQQHIVTLSSTPNGVPVSIAQYDADEVFARVRVVHNIVEPDPSEPTLAEVREMMAEIEDEVDEEKSQ